MSIAHLRKEYSQASLLEADVDPDPVKQFSKWFDEAQSAQIPEPNAMSLATVAANGQPSSRIVLVKEFDQRGFVWFTNYASRKGQDLQQNSYAALLFHWVEIERQVHIKGQVETLTDAENDLYFQSRPLASRIGALASNQSQPIDNRQMLDRQFASAQEKYGDHPPRPPHWGGYRLIADSIEFWQGRSSRLHDRILYIRQTDGTWTLQRLQP